MLQLTPETYFSSEADKEYISVSQYHLFTSCESRALAIINGTEKKIESDSFLQGQLFESLVAGDAQLFMAKHPEMISTRGSTAGQLKAEFQKVVNAAEKFNSQQFFTDIIEKCEKQVILTGKICDVPVKCCLDLFDRETCSIYDIKCMSDFKESWNKQEKKYIPWYYQWGYVLQLAVYREIVKQNFGKEPKEIALLAASKEEVPDIQAIKFSPEVLNTELVEFKNNIKIYDAIKKGQIEPEHCGTCDYCKKAKQIINFTEVNSKC
jgi:hypothetical protein